MHALQRAPWPHNLRQLDATVHRILVDAEGANTLTLEHCLDDLDYLRDEGGARALDPQRVDGAISRAGSISGAARLLGVDRTTVHRVQRKRATADACVASAVAPHASDGEINVAPHTSSSAVGL
jgi:transcriptional regulator of acetoin/glycerol metabolism